MPLNDSFEHFLFIIDVIFVEELPRVFTIQFLSIQIVASKSVWNSGSPEKLFRNDMFDIFDSSISPGNFFKAIKHLASALKVF